MGLMPDLAYTAAGALTGFVVGLTGVGGGALMTPLLLLVWGISPVTAVATDLWFAAITKLVGAGVHHQAGNVDWKMARHLWMGSLPMAALTAVLMGAWHGQWHMPWLQQLIAGVLLFTAISLVFGPHRLARHLQSRLGTIRPSPSFHMGAGVVCGAVLGLLVTLTSIGAGALGSVFLLLLYPGRMVAHRLVATDIVHAIPLSLVAGTGYLLSGLVDMHMLGSLLLGSVPAVLCGSLASSHLRHHSLRSILAVMLIGSGLKILLT